MTSNNVIAFDQVAQILDDMKAGISASEFHGLQTGCLCADDTIVKSNYEPMLLEELACLHPSEKLEELIEDFHQSINEQLAGIKFDFKPLLPDDDASLYDRIVLLSDWCRGFLCGLSLAGLKAENLPDGYVKESIQDLSEIAYTELELDESEDEENAFEELVEYVRIAVQTVHIEIKNFKHENGPATVH